MWRAEQERLATEENAKIVRYIQQQDDKQQQLRDQLARKRDMQSNQQQIMCDRLNEIEVSAMFSRYFFYIRDLKIDSTLRISSIVCRMASMGM